MQNTQKHTQKHTFRPTLAETLIDMTAEADRYPLTVVSRTLGRGLTVLIMREKHGTYVLMLKRENATPSAWEWQAVIKAWPWPTTARAYPSKMTVPPSLRQGGASAWGGWCVMLDHLRDAVVKLDALIESYETLEDDFDARQNENDAEYFEWRLAELKPQRVNVLALLARAEESALAKVHNVRA